VIEPKTCKTIRSHMKIDKISKYCNVSTISSYEACFFFDIFFLNFHKENFYASTANILAIYGLCCIVVS